MNPTRNPDDFRMSFGDHLEELRKRLLIALIAPIVLLIPTLFFGGKIMAILLVPIRESLVRAGLPDRLQVISPLEPFVSYIKLGLIAAALLAAPFMIWQLWLFVAPGLYSSERKIAAILIPGSVVLVVAGLCFNYYVATPLTMRVLVKFGQKIEHVASLAPPPGVHAPPEFLADLHTMPHSEFDPPELKPWDWYLNTKTNQVRIKTDDGRMLALTASTDSAFVQQYEITAYLSMILDMMLGFGIAFQLPLVLLLLGWAGLVDVGKLCKWRKYAFFAAFIVGAFVMPPDVPSQVVLALPLFGLYELSIWLLRLFPRSSAFKRSETSD